jgi:hypothetical protein
MNTNHLRLVFGGSGLFIVLLFVQGYSGWVQSTKASSDVDNAKSATVRQQETDNKIAAARFKSGCIVIGDETNQYVSITEGMKIHGRGNVDNKAPLPNGAVVCDRFGGTAVMQDGAATQYAANAQYAGYSP